MERSFWNSNKGMLRNAQECPKFQGIEGKRRNRRFLQGQDPKEFLKGIFPPKRTHSFVQCEHEIEFLQGTLRNSKELRNSTGNCKLKLVCSVLFLHCCVVCSVMLHTVCVLSCNDPLLLWSFGSWGHGLTCAVSPCPGWGLHWTNIN